ncbi:MAG: signal peptidase II [Planctomycetota bacterium]
MTELNKEQDNTRLIESRVSSSPFTRKNLPDMTAHLLFWPVSIIGFFADLWTKSLIFKWLQPGETYSVIDGFFQLTAVLNAGAAFGLANNRRFFLIATSVIATGAVAAFFYLGKIKNRLAQLALGLFMAGVCGNLYDRIFNNGLVRDFIDVTIWPGKHWPAFNLADSMLCIAVGLLVITFSFSKKTP